MNTFVSWLSYGLPTVIIGIIVCSFFEWWFHKSFMHKRVKVFSYPFERHALVHHDTFKADASYHCKNEEDKHTIPMAWWNGVALAIGGSLPVLIVCFLTNWHWIAVPTTAVLTMYGYYLVYEYIHWCMHLEYPKKPPRFVERSKIFIFLNCHHLLHHKHMTKNFNVVLPLADFFMRTLIREAREPFDQAQGRSLRDVQPKVRINKPTPPSERKKKAIVLMEMP